MTASSRGSRAAVTLLQGAPHKRTGCASLGQSISARAAPRHNYSSTPTTTATDADAPTPYIMPVTTGGTPPPTSPTNKATDHSQIRLDNASYRVRAGVILSRPPILTREPSAFENAFYLYQKRLNERLSSPFARSYYFRDEAQPASIDWAIKFSERKHVMAREIGRLTRQGRDAWDDEALVDKGELYASPDYIRERLYTEAESRVSEDGETLDFEDRLKIERPLPRETAADRNGDVTRLDRALDRTLYLVVKDIRNRWGFPSDFLNPNEDLYEAAIRALADTAGVNMNTWMVGRHPIAHERRRPVYSTDEASEGGRKLKTRGQDAFFLKGRILAGQADLTGNPFSITEFKWLTKDELKWQLQPGLFYSVEKSMPAQ